MLGNDRPYLNQLSISYRGKGIPYGGAEEPRPDGGQNHGFVCLKGRTDLIDSIPELQGERALRSLVLALNAKETALFTIGCLSAEVAGPDGEGYRYTGYIEFALNSQQAVADASSYFPAFFHFDRFLHESEFNHEAMFSWELVPASFLDARIDGFSCAISVTTTLFATRENASASWEAALKALEGFLPAVTAYGPTLY